LISSGECFSDSLQRGEGWASATPRVPTTTSVDSGNFALRLRFLDRRYQETATNAKASAPVLRKNSVRFFI